MSPWYLPVQLSRKYTIICNLPKKGENGTLLYCAANSMLILLFFRESSRFYSSEIGLQSANTSREAHSGKWCNQQAVLPSDLP
jgi:hypothetical protein